MITGPHGQTDGIEEYEAAPPFPVFVLPVTKDYGDIELGPGVLIPVEDLGGYPCKPSCATCEEIRGWADVD